jgi:hypothetical protein
MEADIHLKAAVSKIKKANQEKRREKRERRARLSQASPQPQSVSADDLR